MTTADTVAKRSKCVRRQAGAVIVDLTNRIVATGYNGPSVHLLKNMVYAECVRDCPRAQPDAKHAVNDYTNCYAIHSEANALMYSDRAARHDGTIYVTSLPCWDCAKLLSNSGLRKVVARIDPDRDAHRADAPLQLWRECDIEFVEWKDRKHTPVSKLVKP